MLAAYWSNQWEWQDLTLADSFPDLAELLRELTDPQPPVDSLMNKDHQKIMVDPMFKVISITAVTPTAVAPISVILPVFT